MADESVGSSSAGLVDPVVEFQNNHVACDEKFFQCGAVRLAVRLIGQYLYFHDSKIVVRILETEAYPADDEVYDKRFHDKRADVKGVFKRLKGGVLVAWNPSHYTGERAISKYLFITAGPLDTGDLVHIRSCEPILGLEEIIRRRHSPTSRDARKNLLIGPTRSSEGVGTEWQNDPILYTDASGAQLFRGTLNDDEKIKHGKRILAYNVYYGCPGTRSLYRYALITAKNYDYADKHSALQDWVE